MGLFSSTELAQTQLVFDTRVRDFFNLIKDYLVIEDAIVKVELYNENNIRIRALFTKLSADPIYFFVYFNNSEKVGIGNSSDRQDFNSVEDMLEFLVVTLTNFRVLMQLLVETGCKFSPVVFNARGILAGAEINKLGKLYIEDGNLVLFGRTLKMPLNDPNAVTNIRKALLGLLT